MNLTALTRPLHFCLTLTKVLMRRVQILSTNGNFQRTTNAGRFYNYIDNTLSAPKGRAGLTMIMKAAKE